MPDAVVPEPLDPDAAASREFAKVRRGYDPVEVKAQMVAMAREITRLRSEESTLRRRVEVLESDDSEPTEVDDSDLTRLLGEETVRIIEAARTAASEIKAKAEESSSRLVKDAQERSARTHREADELRSTAARDADELVGAARQRADEMMSDAREAAAELTSEAESEAARLRERAEKTIAEMTEAASEDAERLRNAAQGARDEADEYAERVRAEAVAAADRRAAESESAAEAELETARESGREMVREAKATRERMLRDLAERRRVARQQLEALRAGRERLPDAFASARDALEEATAEVSDSLPAAREAADEAARQVDDDIDAQVAELAAELDHRIEVADADDGPGFLADEATDPDSEIDVVSLVAQMEDRTDGGSSDSGDDDQVERGDAVDEETAGDAEVVAIASVDDQPHLRLVSSSEGDLDDDLDDFDDDDLEDDDDEDDDEDEDEDEDEDDGSDNDGQGASVDDLFARIRNAREDEGEEDAEQAHSSSEDATSGAASRSDQPDELAEPDESEPGEPEPDGSTRGVLDRRDSVLDGLERRVARRLKRQLTDRENDLLHKVRRHKRGAVGAEVLGDRSAVAESFVAVVADDLAETVLAGAAFVRGGPDGDPAEGPDVDPAGAADELAEAVRTWICDPLWTRLEDLVTDAAGTDRDELVEQLRAVCREWRNDRVGDLSGDLATLAFNRGILSGVAPGTGLCWVVDHGGLPCPDAEDNRLAGEVPAGSPYPTGVSLPPAHPGCRCLLVRGDR